MGEVIQEASLARCHDGFVGRRACGSRAHAMRPYVLSSPMSTIYLLCLEVDGEADLETGATRFRIQLHIPAVLADDDVVADVQAQPRALARRLGGEEAFEYLRLNLRWYSRSIVFDLDEYGILLAGARSNGDLTLAVERIRGIVKQVRPNLVQLAPVPLDYRQVGRVFTPHADAVLELALENHDRVVQAFVDVDSLDRGLIEIRVQMLQSARFQLVRWYSDSDQGFTLVLAGSGD